MPSLPRIQMLSSADALNHHVEAADQLVERNSQAFALGVSFDLGTEDLKHLVERHSQLGAQLLAAGLGADRLMVDGRWARIRRGRRRLRSLLGWFLGLGFG